MEKMPCSITDGLQYDDVMSFDEPELPEYLDSVATLADYLCSEAGDDEMDSFIEELLNDPETIVSMIKHISKHNISGAGSVFFSALARHRALLIDKES
jgi:hypothetical protein